MCNLNFVFQSNFSIIFSLATYTFASNIKIHSVQPHDLVKMKAKRKSTKPTPFQVNALAHKATCNLIFIII